MRRIPTHKETRCQTNKICDVLQSKAVGNVFATDRADKELFRRGLLQECKIRFAALFFDVERKSERTISSRRSAPYKDTVEQLYAVNDSVLF